MTESALVVEASVHIADVYGLTDPILCRTPRRAGAGWRIGHVDRTIPDGYLESLPAGTNHIRQRDLARYYDVIRHVTRDDLFSWNRLSMIVRLNAGGYDYLLERYAESIRRPW